MANIKLTVKEDRFVQGMNNAAGAAGRLAAVVNVQLARSMREADYVTNNFRQGLGKLGDKISSVGQNLSTYITAPLTILSGVAAKAYGDIDQLKRGLDVYGASLESIKQTAKLPGLGIEEAGQATIKFLSVKYAVDLSNKAVREFGNALVYSGRGKEELNGIATAFAQIKGKGAVMAQEINQIAERLPMIRDLMQQAFGTSDTEKLQKMGIGADEFLAKIIAQMEKLPRVSGGFKVGWENVIDSVKIGAYEFFNAADKIFGLTEKLNALSSWIDGLVTSFKTLSPETKKMIMIAGGLAAAIGPVLVAIGGIITISGPAIAAIGAISAPMLAIAAVTISVASTIIRHWDEIKKALQDTFVWRAVGAVAKVGLEYLGDIFGVFIDFLSGDWASLWGNLKNIVKRTWNLIIDAIAFGIKTAISLNKKLFEVLGLDSLASGAGSAIQFVDKFLGKIKSDAPVATNSLNKLAEALNKVTDNTDKPTTPNIKNVGKINFKLNFNVSEIKKSIEQIIEENRRGYKLAFSLADSDLTGIQERMVNRINSISKKMGDASNYAIQSLIPLKMQEKADEYKQALADIFESLNIPIDKNIKMFSDSNLLKVLEELEQALESYKKSFSQLSFDIGTSIIEGIGTAIGSGDFSSVASGIIEMIGGAMVQIGKAALLANVKIKAIMEAIKNASPTLGIGLSLGLIALGAAVKAGAANLRNSANNSVSKFANGGIVSGPTYAMVGEYSNARNNPEVIAPLSKLKNIIGGGVGDRQLIATIELDKLKIALDRVDRNSFGLL